MVLKLIKLFYFESIGRSLTIKIQHDHIHKICEKVFPRTNGDGFMPKV